MANERENVRIFNPLSGQYETGHEVAQMHFSPDPVAEHTAQAEGQVAPGDRSPEELISLTPAEAGPVVTANNSDAPVNAEFSGGTESAPGQLGDVKGVKAESKSAGKDK